MKFRYAISNALAFVMSILILYQFALSFTYPKKPFAAEIVSASAEFSVDPNLIRAVIFCESGFNPSAVSPAGAVGLMQIMPDTARFCMVLLGLQEEEPIDSLLKKPEMNIRLGAFYLSYLFKKFDSERDVLAAYNAGEGNVRAWKKQELKEIPFLETRTYVKRVARAQRAYQYLFSAFPESTF